MANITFPDFGVPFPYQNLPAQLQASLAAIPQGQYQRFGAPSTVLPQQGLLQMIPPGAPQGSAWNPIMQVPPPPVTPGMTMPATPPLPPSSAPLGPTVNPGGYSGTPPSPAPTVPASTNGAVSKAPGNNKMATAGLLDLNVSDGAPGIQSTQGLTANDAARFAFTIPQGFNTNGGLSMFSFSPTGDDSMAQRTITFTDANGNPVGGAPNTGIEAPGYFSVGGPALDRWGRPDASIPVLQPGQQYFANVSGGNGPQGPANIDYGLNLRASSAPQNPLQQALQAFLARHPGYHMG